MRVSEQRAALVSPDPRPGIGAAGDHSGGQREVTTKVLRSWFTDRHRPHVLALGNQKGGVGKSTVAIHLIIGLIRHGFSVGSIDLDERQGTLSRFMRNRQRFLAASEIALPQPDIQGLYRSIHDNRQQGRRGRDLAPGQGPGAIQGQGFHRHRHRRRQHLPVALRPYPGRYADHPAERQLPGPRRPGAHRCRRRAHHRTQRL